MASSPINSWRIEGEKVEAVTYYFLGFQITAYYDCSQEIKRHLLLGRKAITNPDSILKNRDKKQTFMTKGCVVKDMVFPMVMYGYESWTIMKAEHQNWCF